MAAKSWSAYLERRAALLRGLRRNQVAVRARGKPRPRQLACRRATQTLSHGGAYACGPRTNDSTSAHYSKFFAFSFKRLAANHEAQKCYPPSDLPGIITKFRAGGHSRRIRMRPDTEYHLLRLSPSGSCVETLLGQEGDVSDPHGSLELVVKFAADRAG